MRYVVEEILKEELGRLGEAVNSYSREIQKLPKGSVQKKNTRGLEYLYLAVRDGDKLRYRYLGKPADEKLQELSREIGLRRRYRQLLGEAKRNKDRVKRMLHGKRRAVLRFARAAPEV